MKRGTIFLRLLMGVDSAKVQKNAHFIENFAFRPSMPPAKKIAFFSRRRADYGFFFVNLSAKYELFFQ